MRGRTKVKGMNDGGGDSSSVIGMVMVMAMAMVMVLLIRCDTESFFHSTDDQHKDKWKNRHFGPFW